MLLVEEELLTLPEHLSSPPDFSGVRAIRSFVVYVCFVDRFFCPLSFGHCAVCSSIYGFWLPLWYLQTLLVTRMWYLFGIYILVLSCVRRIVWVVEIYFILSATTFVLLSAYCQLPTCLYDHFCQCKTDIYANIQYKIP